MGIYTRAGDRGETGLQGGRRVPKSDARIMAYGAVDEANCLLGLAAAFGVGGEGGDEGGGGGGGGLARLVGRLQDELFAVGADLSDPDPGSAGAVRIGQDDVSRLEADIDRLDAGLEPLTTFVMPGGSRPAALLHLARAAVRRAEAHMAAIGAPRSRPGGAAAGPRAASEYVNPHCMSYVNRLSDLLFTMARAANSASGLPDVPWRRKDTL